jgi:electron transfer flavoprotein alpha/beta subunit
MDRTVGRIDLQVPSSSSLEPWAVIHVREEKRVDVRSSWNGTHIRHSSAQQPVVVSVQSRISEQAREKANQRSFRAHQNG